MLSALGLDYIYLCQPVSAGRAAEWLSAAKVTGYAGFNATMPHKLDLVPLMDELDEDARLYQSVNTVCIKRGRYTDTTPMGGAFAGTSGRRSGPRRKAGAPAGRRGRGPKQSL